MKRDKKPKAPRYFPSKEAFCVTYRGTRYTLAAGAEDDQDVRARAWARYWEVVRTPVKDIIRAVDWDELHTREGRRNAPYSAWYGGLSEAARARYEADPAGFLATEADRSGDPRSYLESRCNLGDRVLGRYVIRPIPATRKRERHPRRSPDILATLAASHQWASRLAAAGERLKLPRAAVRRVAVVLTTMGAEDIARVVAVLGAAADPAAGEALDACPTAPAGEMVPPGAQGGATPTFQAACRSPGRSGPADAVSPAHPSVAKTLTRTPAALATRSSGWLPFVASQDWKRAVGPCSGPSAGLLLLGVFGRDSAVRRTVMALRDWVVRQFGEGAARKIEQFVEGTVFEDKMVSCPNCKTPVAAGFVTQHGRCPVCQAAASDRLTEEALERQRLAALEKAEAAKKEAEQIEQELAARRRATG